MKLGGLVAFIGVGSVIAACSSSSSRIRDTVDGGTEDAAGGTGGSSSGGSGQSGAAGNGAGGGGQSNGGAGGSGGNGGSAGDGGSAGGGTAGSGGSGGGGEPPCEAEPTELRLWTLHLGQSDYVVLKNPSDCQVQLEGVEIIFDDRDDAFPGMEIDCTVRLPEFILPPRASVRVHEDARPGDIDALAAKVTVCDGDVPFNPQRGGATYLCDGGCSAGTLIDAIVHTGYDPTFGAPSAIQFGVTFSSPVSGIADATQNARRYQRVATAGAKPNFLGSDWALQSRTLFADFEAGLNVQIGDAAPVAWSTTAGQSADIATSAITAALGTVSLRITHTGNDGISTALTRSLSGITAPREVSYFARSEAASAAAGYFDLLMSPFSAMQVSFEPTGLGAERENGVRTETPFVAATWHQIEMRDVDYVNRRFDFYVDRALVASGVPFWTNAPFVDQLRLYSVSAGSTAYFDHIELWQ